MEERNRLERRGGEAVRFFFSFKIVSTESREGTKIKRFTCFPKLAINEEKKRESDTKRRES